MKQTDFFFTSVIDLKDHHLAEAHMNAMYVVYEACCEINKPEKYGSSVQSIIIDAIHQDYDSKFHPERVTYNMEERTIEAGIKVEIDKVLDSSFLEAVSIYEGVILQVFDIVSDQICDFDFNKLKADLHSAIQEATKVSK